MAMQHFRSQSATATLAEALATVITIPCADMERVFIDLATSNDSALDQFGVQGKFNDDATARTLYNTAAAFTSPAGLIVGASGDLTTLAANSNGWLIVDTRGLYQLILQAAQAAGDATTLTIEVGGA